MPAGRPTDYKRTYCGLVIEAMAEGKSMTAFAAEIGVARSTLNLWMDAHPEFMEAVKIGKAKCAAWWEAQGRKAAMSGGAPGQVTAIIFGLKNMAADDWREKVTNEHSGPDGGPIEVSDARERINRRIASLAARSGSREDTGGPE